mgnify:CR=1 FL=1
MSRRVWAFTIDLIIIGLMNKTVMLSFQNFLNTFYYQLQFSTQRMLENNLTAVSYVSYCIIVWGYFQLSYYLGEGKTPGKHFLSLQTYGAEFFDSGEYYLNFHSSTMRTLGSFLGVVFILPLAVPFVHPRGKSLSDIFSGPDVISQEQMLIYEQEFEEKRANATSPEDPQESTQLFLFPEDNTESKKDAA